MGHQKHRLDFQPDRWYSGGYIDRVEEGIVDVTQTEYGAFSLSARVRNKPDSSQWWLSCIYGPSIHANKKDFWVELDSLDNLRMALAVWGATSMKYYTLHIETESLR